MSEQDSNLVTVENGFLLLGGKPLYMCTVHRGCGYLPFYNPDNGSWGEQAEWISQWDPVLHALESGDDDVQGDDLGMTLAPRPDGTHQATYRGYQLYTYTPDENGNPNGEVQGFWERVNKDTSHADEDRKDCPAPEPRPSHPRGP